MPKVRPPAKCHPESSHYAKGLCKDCYKRAWDRSSESKRAYGAQWREANREKTREYSRQYAQRHPRRVLESARKYRVKIDPMIGQRRRKYGLSHDDYIALVTQQEGRCAICGTDQPGGDRAWRVDHDHATGRVRGLLCQRCNSGIGMLRDDIAIIRAAIAYLERAA